MSYKQTYLRQYFFSSNAGNSGAIVPLYKALAGTALYPTTAAGNPGINNGGIDPYISSQNIKLVRACLTVSNAATSNGTWTPPGTAEFDVYANGYSARTLIGSIFFNVTNANINNNIGSAGFQGTYFVTNLNLLIPAGLPWGIEFKNVSGNSNIGAIGGTYLVVDAEA